MRYRFTELIPYVIVITVMIYIVPLKGLGINTVPLFAFLIVPMICFVSGMVLSVEEDFRWYYPVIVGAIFLPAVSLFPDFYEYIYTLLYIVATFCGCLFGFILDIIQSNK